MKFYLGTHKANWLRRAGVPLFISHRTLRTRKSAYPPAIAPWALDSGGFTELGKFNGWVTTEGEYADSIARYEEEIGSLDWAAPQDWMCEPQMLVKTGKAVAEHQELTVGSVVSLRSRGLRTPIVPVLQGQQLADYLRCITLYEAAGIDLFSEPIVGLGSVCRRQATTEIDIIVQEISGLGLRLHGFGVKKTGPLWCLESADSMAWSLSARKSAPLVGCRHANCANCMWYALQWRAELLHSQLRPQRPRLTFEVPA